MNRSGGGESGLPALGRARVPASAIPERQFPSLGSEENLPRPSPPRLREGEPPLAGRAGAGRGGAGESRPGAGLAGGPRAGGRGAQCVRLRSARLAGRGHHMSSGTGDRPQPARGRPCSCSPALAPGPNHVYLLLLLFQGLWQFQEEIR